MTPAQLTGLAALLIEYREWLADDVPGTLEQALVDAVIEHLAFQRRRLINEGAK